MNTKIILELQSQIEELSSSLKKVEKHVNALKIDEQYRLNANTAIAPGTACKVSYDKNGLIVNGSQLESNDIPELEINKIKLLKKLLDEKVSDKDLEKFKVDIMNMINPVVATYNEIIGTGIKVNYNKEGKIVSSSELLVEDIPELPIEKINGLSDIIDEMRCQSVSVASDDIDNAIKVNAGTYTKVSVDQYGRITYGSKLELNDIPRELVNNINLIQSKLIEFASQVSLDEINKKLINKVDANPAITAGTYIKVRVDSKGLVVSGDKKLDINDLPELNISNITGLEKAIRDKADHKDVMALTDTISSLVNSMGNVGEIKGIKNELESKASDERVDRIETKVESINNKLNTLINSMPSDMIFEQLNQIQNELSNLTGRMSSIEKYLKITN